MENTLNYSILSSESLLNMTKSTLAFTGDQLTTLPFLVPYHNKVDNKYKGFVTAFEQEKINPMLKHRNELNIVRMDSYRSFRKHLEASQNRPNVDLANAAANMLLVFRKNAWSLKSTGYKDRTGIITAVISEFQSKFAAELTLTGSDEYLAELITAETNFETVDKSIIEREATIAGPNVYEVRPELIVELRNLYTAIGLHETIEPSPELSALILKLEDLIRNTSASAKANVTRARNAKKEENSGEPTNPDTVK